MVTCVGDDDDDFDVFVYTLIESYMILILIIITSYFFSLLTSQLNKTSKLFEHYYKNCYLLSQILNTTPHILDPNYLQR